MHCNFLQMVENSVDQHHFKWLHRTPKTRACGQTRLLTSDPFEFGIKAIPSRARSAQSSFMHHQLFLVAEHEQSRLSSDGDHPAAFAATHEGYEALRWRVPVDDTNTMHFTLYFAPRD